MDESVNAGKDADVLKWLNKNSSMHRKRLREKEREKQIQEKHQESSSVDISPIAISDDEEESAKIREIQATPRYRLLKEAHVPEDCKGILLYGFDAQLSMEEIVEQAAKEFRNYRHFKHHFDSNNRQLYLTFHRDSVVKLIHERMQSELKIPFGENIQTLPIIQEPVMSPPKNMDKTPELHPLPLKGDPSHYRVSKTIPQESFEVMERRLLSEQTRGKEHSASLMWSNVMNVVKGKKSHQSAPSLIHKLVSTTRYDEQTGCEKRESNEILNLPMEIEDIPLPDESPTMTERMRPETSGEQVQILTPTSPKPVTRNKHANGVYSTHSFRQKSTDLNP